MNNLEDLMQAMVTVIVRYHQSQPQGRIASLSIEWTEVETAATANSNSSEVLTEKNQVEALLAQDTDVFYQSLNQFILEATTASDTRRTFLQYLAFLSKLLHRYDEPADYHVFESPGFDVLVQNRLVEFLSNLKTIYYAPVRLLLPITYENETVNVWGLSSLKSKMASIVHALLVQPFRITATTEEHHLNQLAELLFLRSRMRVVDDVKTLNQQLMEENATLREEKEELASQLTGQLANQSEKIDRLTRRVQQVSTETHMLKQREQRPSFFGTAFGTLASSLNDKPNKESASMDGMR